MLKVKTGDTVGYRPGFGRGYPTEAEVTAIELCPNGEKYGQPVDELTVEDHLESVIELNNGKWVYLHQLDSINGVSVKDSPSLEELEADHEAAQVATEEQWRIEA